MYCEREKRLLFSLSENHQQFPDTINSYRRTFFIPVGNVDQITFIFVRTPKGNLVSFTFIWANSTWLWFLKELYPLRVSLFSPWAKTHALQLPCPFFVNFYKNITKKKKKKRNTYQHFCLLFSYVFTFSFWNVDNDISQVKFRKQYIQSTHCL